VRRIIGIVFRLIKYQLSLTVAFSAVTGFFLTGKTNWTIGLLVLTGVYSLASGAAALNQIQERKTDALMTRTRKRPLPSGELTLLNGWMICLFFVLTGFLLLLFLGELPAILGLTTLLLYNFIYTPLKRITAFSIIPGAIVGAICPLIGWTSGTGILFHSIPLFIALFVFLWQIPHFWLLLLQYGQEYKNAGFAGVYDYLNTSGIKKCIFLWALITSLYLLSYPFFGYHMNRILFSVIFLVNLFFIILFYRLLFRQYSGKATRQAFILINSFAVVMFCLLIFSRI
jgi:protoheme IX farnesyltransferase